MPDAPAPATGPPAPAVMFASRLEGRAPALLVEALVHHLEALVARAPVEVQQAAGDALLRRLAAMDRERLRVASGPTGDRVLGPYHTRTAGGPLRPRTTLLRALEPLAGSCDCADFRRASLGLCKHLLTVLGPLAARPLQWDRGLREPPPPPGLRWHPVRPLTGAGDWLARVEWHGEAPPEDLAWEPAGESRWRLSPPPRGAPAHRRAVVDSLRGRLPQGAAARDAEPALAVLLEEEEEVLARAESLRLSAPELRRQLRGFRRTLYRYQREGLARFFATGRLLLADDMGLGKTMQAMAACHILFHTGRVRRGLLVVPASLRAQWQREWEAATDVPLVPVEGSPAARAALYRRDRPGFLLMGYEQVLRDARLLQAERLELVVLDEAQRIKNFETKTSSAVKRLEPPLRLVLTGTPMENRLEELASLMEWVEPSALEPRWRLVPLHTPAPRDGGPAAARHLSTLRRRLAPTFLRRARREVLAQLPPRTDTRVPVPLTPKQLEAHEGLAGPIAQLVGRARGRPLLPADFMRLMQLLTTQRIICNGLGLLRFEETWPSLRDAGPPTWPRLRSLCSPKLLELRELVANLAVAQGRKVVVFSQWRRMLTLAQWAVSDILTEAGLTSLVFSGEESLEQRSRNVEDFHHVPEAHVLFSTDAGGLGLNLQRAATACIHLELPWNPAVLEQRTSRIWRLGQEHPIDVYTLVSSQGIEAHISEVVSDKSALFAGLFDSTEDTVAFEREGAFTERVARLVEPQPGPAPQEVAAERPTAPQLPSPEDMQGLLGSLQVRTTPEGGLVLEAPPQAAAALVTLFTGMLRLLAPAASPSQRHRQA